MEQKMPYKKGFVLGKFLPPHNGHLHMIHSAMNLCEELTVLVCTIKKESIPGELRFQWMKELLPTANVIHVTDEVPSYPHEDPNFWNIWTALLKRETHPETEVFFSSEDYGDEVAERLGIKHVMIDKARAVVPVSGTSIRDQPIKYWDYIPDNVKSYFVKRIVLTGPESTGKTTMAELLAKHFNTVWAEEYGRDYFVKKDGKLNLEDIQHIADGQIVLEEEAASKATKFLFCDTDLIVTQIWSEIYFKECPQDVINKNHQRKYELFLLMDIDIPWQDDGTREFPHLRAWHFNRIKQELDARKLNYTLISGDKHTRFTNAIHAINSFFKLV
jgi:NadR type nicotinamide-nucleotide adenylyltransferase